jgi:hypothetical protein
MNMHASIVKTYSYVEYSVATNRMCSYELTALQQHEIIQTNLGIIDKHPRCIYILHIYTDTYTYEKGGGGEFEKGMMSITKYLNEPV